MALQSSMGNTPPSGISPPSCSSSSCSALLITLTISTLVCSTMLLHRTLSVAVMTLCDMPSHPGNGSLVTISFPNNRLAKQWSSLRSKEKVALGDGGKCVSHSSNSPAMLRR